MPKVKDLAIKLQSGTTDTYYASWAFDGGTTTTSTGLKAGSLVSIKSGATYYNGVSIPSWVMSDKWYLVQVKGDRAVLGKNYRGTQDIQSPINTKYLTGTTGSSSSSSESESTVDHYTVKWSYDTGDGIWFSSSGSTDTKEKYSTYNPPSNALKIKVTVTPVSKTYKEGDKDKSHWTGTATSKQLTLHSVLPPDKPSTPSVSIDKFKLTASLENISDARTDKIQFQAYNGNDEYQSRKPVTVLTRRASYTWNLEPGGEYRVRCRAIYMNGNNEVYSEWSDYSGTFKTIPSGVTNVACAADSETSVKVTWDAAATATKYTVEYSTKEEYFDRSTEVSSMSVEQSTAYVTGLESGRTWFFRVKATNNSGDSGWSDIVSTIIGTKPEPPTTWALTSTAIVGDDVTLYWVHNSEDGSKQTEAEIRLDIAGVITTVTVPGIAEEDEAEPMYSYTFNTKEYSEGAEIWWKVRTTGVVSKYSDWSTQRTVKLYAPPVLDLSVSTDENGVISTLPIAISTSVEPITQKPMSYHVAIVANESYETTNAVGSDVFVTAGTEVYSKVFNVSDRDLSLSISAGDVVLEHYQSYNLTVTVSMDSGLTAEATVPFTVDWVDQLYTPNASIAIDFDTLSAYVAPFCTDSEGVLVEDVTLSVYRREANGTFTELATGVVNNGVHTITDPHPALDYARYRIVAQSISTGDVSYEDLPGQPILEPSIVIQWDEDWVNYDYSEAAEPEIPPWTGSMLRLPYNVDINEKYKPDVSLIEYIGREHPVSYYGTQRGESASWSTVIDKEDKETLFALRRLAAWRGNVYVREPSGTGYWAQITVSFPKKHKELTIPVSFEINRVEGDL